MNIMLTGGSANGKSTFAEKLALQFPGPHYYLAAMRPYGPEAKQRIARHRAMHDRKGFHTVERYTDLAGLCLPDRGTVLLECLCNLLNNEMFDDAGQIRDALPQILIGLEALAAQSAHLILVTNDVGSDLLGYDKNTLCYMKAMGQLNSMAARQMDAVLEVTAGIPIVRQGDFDMAYRQETGDCDMILIIGAEASGKRTYVKEMLGYGQEEIATAQINTCPVVDALHQMIARDPEQCENWLPQLLQKEVVICNEVGSGIIPANARDRRIREQTGRMCVLLAKHAKQVIRMVCGIPVVIK